MGADVGATGEDADGRGKARKARERRDGGEIGTGSRMAWHTGAPAAKPSRRGGSIVTMCSQPGMVTEQTSWRAAEKPGNPGLGVSRKLVLTDGWGRHTACLLFPSDMGDE